MPPRLSRPGRHVDPYPRLLLRRRVATTAAMPAVLEEIENAAWDEAAAHSRKCNHRHADADGCGRTQLLYQVEMLPARDDGE